MGFGLDGGGGGGGGMAGGAASGAATGTMIMPGWGTLIGAGIGALGAGLSMGQAAKQRKRLAQLRQAMLNQVDTGASNARSRVAYAAGQAQGGATQDSINRGFYNSSVATDAQSGVRQGAANDMAGVDQQLGQQKAGILQDTFDTGGGADMSGLGHAVGLLLSRRLGSAADQSLPSSTGSPVSQDANKLPATLQPEGNPETSSATFEPGGDLPIASALGPQTAADAVGYRLRMRKKTGMGGYGRIA